jgi:endonuclease III
MDVNSIKKVLVQHGEALLAIPFEFRELSTEYEINLILNDLENHAHIYVFGCLMMRQMRSEKAWLIPYEIGKKLNSFKFSSFKSLSEKRILQLMIQPEPLHRFSDVMGKCLYSAIRKIVDQYEGNAANIWLGNPSSATLVRRFLEFDGMGPKIATMAANILVRDFKIPVSDKISIDISPDVHVRRVFTRLGLIDKGSTNEVLIYVAREMNPTYPGIFDLPAWEIGRNWCRPTGPDCQACFLNEYCPKLL